MNSIENVWKIIKEDIGNQLQLPSLKETMWKQVCEEW